MRDGITVARTIEIRSKVVDQEIESGRRSSVENLTNPNVMKTIMQKCIENELYHRARHQHKSRFFVFSGEEVF
jgi:hypothetical protein